MRLAYVANSRIPSRAANTVHVLNMSAAFASEGHSVRLVARGPPAVIPGLFDDFSLAAAFELKLLPVTRPAFFDRIRFVRHVRQSMAEMPPDFVYGRSCYALLAGVPESVPFAYDLHIFPAERHRRRLEALLFRRPNFLFVSAINRAVADQYEAAYPGLRGRILVAPCAADPVPRTAKSRDPGPMRVYYVGHLYKGRGIDLVLEMARAASDMEFHLVGGEDRDIAFWSARAAENVMFHGYVKPVDLPYHYERADFCIAPHGRAVSIAGGGGDIARWMSPMKIFEYMAHGKAMIAADLPAIREIINPGADGLLCPPGDLGAWLEAVRSLSIDAGLRERLGEAGRQKLEKNYTWQARARRIVDFAREQMALSGIPTSSARKLTRNDQR